MEPTQISFGQRFMTDLLVWSLMADGGLETALFEALRAEIAELADANETFELTTSHATIPLLHLVKQLLRNGSSVTQLHLEEFRNYFKITTTQKSSSTLSISLLQRFQRLLIAKIYTRDVNCTRAAESLLKKYLCHLSFHVVDTLNLAYHVASLSPKNFMYVVQILKGDIIGKLLLTNIVYLYKV